MKYALISEFEIAKLKAGLSPIGSESHRITAREIVASLKPSEPFAAWRSTSNDECDGFVHFPLPNQKLSPQDTPLFALEQSK